MNHVPHPAPADLAKYLDHPNNEAGVRVRLHLASCPLCRRTAEGLDTLSEVFTALRQTAARERGAGHLTNQEIEQYILVNESNALHRQWQPHISSCDICKEAVLLARARRQKHQRHGSGSSGSLNMAITHDPADRDFDQGRSSDNLVAKLATSWKHYAAIPLAAAAGFLLALLLLPMLPLPSLLTSPELQLAVYRDDPVLHFSDTDPSQGLGFFTGATARSESYAGVRFTAQHNGDFIAEWSPIENASEYRFRVFGLSGITSFTVLDVRTAKTTVTLPAAALQSGKRYEWQVSGTTKDGSSFSTAGGFVVYPRDPE